MDSGTVYVGQYSDSVGIINVSGGKFTHTGNSEFDLGGNGASDAGRGIFNQSGGEVTLPRLKIYDVATGTNEYNFSGGQLNVNKYIWSAGIFKVLGNAEGSSINTKRLQMDNDASVLSIVLGADGATLIEVTGTLSDTFSGAVLGKMEVDVLAGFNGTVGSVYDILWSATTIDTTLFNFTNLSSVDFNWAIVDATNYGYQSGQLLQLSIPEPTTIALLSLGGFLFVRRQK